MDIVALIGGLLLILVGANALTDGAASVAKRFNISSLVIGLTIVAFGTSAPELTVSIVSALKGSADMAIGNVVGSNIFNTLMIVGCTAAIVPIGMNKGTLSKEIPLCILASVVLFICGNDVLINGAAENTISSSDGMLLLCFFAIFLGYTFAIAHNGNGEEETKIKLMPVWKSGLFIAGGLAGLIYGGQFFVKPGTELEWFKKWKETRLKWHKALGFGDDHYRYHDHEKLAHYANAATDIEFLMPFGFKEVEGIHSRTNFDLSQHEKFSGKSIKYFDPEINESYTPYVIETSIGVDRMFLSIMSAAYCEETLENGETRVVLKLPAALAPVKLAVMPLVKKDGLPEKAREIMNDLKFHFHCQYDEKDSIGKRYRRQDAIGTPYCITIDHQTLEDNCVTLRNRDTMKQERVAISELNNIIADKVSITSLLKTLQ